MVMNQQIMVQILNAFDIHKCVDSWEELIHIEDRTNGAFILKQYFRVHTIDSTFILKILSLPMCSNILLEEQSRFSEFYRENGIPTPKRYVSKDGKFLIPWRMEGEDVYISIEDDGGMQVSEFSLELAAFMGNLLGKMHLVSLTHNCHFRQGSLYTEFKEGKADYLQLWKTTGTDYLPQNTFKEVLDIYNKRIEYMREVWDSLPRYTVQSDMYRMNLTQKEGQIWIIDYDRMGDEVLLADMLVTWFRFRFDPYIRGHLPTIDDPKSWRRFFEAYVSVRTLCMEEEKALKDIYAVIGAVFGTKMLVNRAAKGDEAFACEKLNMILEVLKGYGL